MGENRASLEAILGGFVERACCVKNDYLSNTPKVACLHSFCSDNLKCVHSKSVGYNWCKSSFASEEKNMNGEKNYGF
jgi:hypothetical protein